jgi:hypothetical protein
MASLMQVFDDRFQAECLDGQRRCPKHVEFYNRMRLVGYLKRNE